MYLQRIFSLTPVQQSDVFPPFLTWSNVFCFLCLSPLSPLLPLSCFLLSSALPLVGQHAFGSISVPSPHVTPCSPRPPAFSTSINLSRQDRLPVPFLHEMPLNERRDGDVYFPLLSSLLLPRWAFRGWRDRTVPHPLLQGYCLPFIFFQFIHDPYSSDPPNIKVICSFSWEIPGDCPKTGNAKGFALNLFKTPWDSFCSLKTLKI